MLELESPASQSWHSEFRIVWIEKAYPDDIANLIAESDEVQLVQEMDYAISDEIIEDNESVELCAVIETDA